MRIGENARIFFSEREKSVPAMRVTTLVNKLIGLQGLWVRGFHFQADKARVVVDVVPRRRKPLCGICGRKVRKNKDRYNRYWRHLDLFGVRTYLRYSIRRVVYRRCGVVREKVPWADKGSRFTKSFEQEVAWLAQRTDVSAVANYFRVTWRSVRRIIQRVVAEQRDERRELDGLRVIGMDETRYYSKAVRRLDAVIIMIATVVYVQAQIVAGGIISNIVFGIPTEWGMIGFTVILLVYTSIGGMLAVVYTDFIQLVIMIVGVLAALPLAIRGIGGLGPLFTYVQAVKPETFTWESFPPALLFTMGLAFTLGTIATPEKLVRLYTMKDMRTIRRGILFAILVATGLNLAIFVIALTTIVILPALPSGDLAMAMVARGVLPTVLGSVLLAAIAAAIMSTVDSHMLVAGSALAHDIYEPFARTRARRRVFG